MNNCARKEPAQSLHIGRETGHKIARLILVEKRFREAQDAVKKALLDAYGYQLLETGTVELLPQLAQHFRHSNHHQKKYGSQQQMILFTEDNIVSKVADNEGLRQTEQGGEDDEHGPNSALSPMPGYKRPQVLEATLHSGRTALTGNAVLG